MRRLRLSILAVFHAFMCSALIYFGSIESAIFRYGPVGDPLFRKNVLVDEFKVGITIYSTNRLMTSCVNELQSILQQWAASENRLAFANKCHTFSQQVLSTAPFNSLAWIVSATSSQQLGDMVAMNKALVTAQRIAPNEQWLAIGRYQLAVDNVGSLSDEAKSAYDSDLSLLAQSNFGVRAIAQRYVGNPDFREHITNIVSKLPEKTQKRFLNSVRTAIKNAN